jgi:hypothetical protein
MAFTRDDVVKDTPTNTFATLNPLAPDTSNMFDMTEGNLRLYTNTPFNSDGRYITTLPFVHTMGKIYFEIAQMTDAITIGFTQNSNYFGIYGNTNQNFEINAGADQGGRVTWQYRSSNGNFPFMNTSTTEVVGLLINFIANEFTIYLATASYTYSFGYNNWINFDSTADIHLVCSNGGNDGYARFNFGQDPTFANNRVPTKVYTDASGHGRFFYEPPAGAMALCTANLDTANLQPAEYIVDETNQHLLTYNGNAQISKFSPYTTDGWSINFDSNIASSQVRTPVHSDLEFGTNDFTVEFWLYHMKGDSDETIVSYPQWQGGGTTNGTAWQIRLSNTDYLITDYGNKSSWVFNGNHTDLYVKRHQWNHIVLQRNGTAIKIYCNGKPSSTQYNIGTGSITDALTGFNTNFLCIGGYSGNSQDLGGYIADFRIVKGTAVYTPDGNGYISAPNAKLTAITNTKFLLSVDSKGFEDSSGTNKTVTINSSPSISDWSPYQRSNDFDTAFFRAKDNYYGGSFYFDGSGDYLSNNDVEFYLDENDNGSSSTPSNFSFNFWTYLTDLSAQYRVFFSRYGVSWSYQLFWDQTNKRFWFNINSSGSTTNLNLYFSHPTGLNVNQWHHISFRREGTGTTSSTYRLYLDGIQIGGDQTDNGKINRNGSSSPFRIGTTAGGTGSLLYEVKGYITDFQLKKGAQGVYLPFNESTTPPSTKISSDANTKLLLQPWHTKTSAGVMSLIDSYAQDETGKSLTYYNGATIVDSSPYKGSNFGSFSLDGVSQYVFTPDHTDFNLSSNDFTIEQWVKLRDLTESTLLNQSIGGATSDSAFIFYINGSASLIFYLTPGTGWDKNTSGYTMSANVWYHVAAVRNGNSLDLYVNGNKVGTTTDVTGYVVGNSTRRLQIGAQESSYYLNGIVTDARIVNGQALYTTDFIPPAYPLSATHYTTDGTDPATSSTKQSITGTPALLTQPGKVTKRNNVAAQDPEKHFKAVTYDGNGGTKTVTGIEFQPDFVWIKSRSNSYGHNIHDVIRGPDSYLSSHSTVAENTDYANICVLNSNGFALSSSSSGNVTGTTNVAWCWKAGGAPSGDDKGVVDGVERTITGDAKLDAGTITPTRMSVNTKAGFSIVKYVGTGSAATVPHGLSSAPDLIIAKNLDDTANWLVYHKSLSSNIHYLHLELPNSEASNSAFWSGFSANTFTLGNSNHINGLSDDIIAYCWHSVAGYSAFGSFSGNNSTDGPFIYTGFKPAFLMVKLYTGTSNADYHSWVMYDNSRITNNPNHSPLYANRSHAEGKRGNTAGDSGGDTLYLDLLSNGFKCRQNGTELNGNGGANDKFIYAAFAEQPIKFSNAR